MLQLLTPVLVRIHGTADTLVVVARRFFNHFLQGREPLDAEFLETDGIQFDLLRELRDVEHLFFRLADVAVDEVPMQIEVVLCQDRKRIPDLLLGNALLKLLQDSVVRRFDPDQEKLETRFRSLVEDPGMPRDVNPGLDNKDLLDLVLDNQIAELFAPLRVREEVVIAEEHDIGRDRLQFFNDRFDRPLRIVSLLSERIHAECAELAFEWTPSCCQYRVERLPAEPNTILNPVIIVLSQGPVGKRNTCDVRQRMVFIVDDFSVLPIGKSADILIWHSRNDFFDDFFTLTTDDHIDIWTTLKQVLDFLCCFVAPDYRADLTRQLGDEITDVLEPGLPLDADAQKVYLFPDELAQRLQVLVGRFIPKVEKRHLIDQALHARGDVLKAGRRKNSHRRGRIAEIRIQHKSVLVLDHTEIIAAKNR